MKASIVVRAGFPFNYDVKAASSAAALGCKDPSLAEADQAKDCDINEIVRRFNLTGQLPSDVRVPLSGDFTDVVDFKSAMNAIRSAQESFDAMPAAVRARFHNDPEEFVDFCTTLDKDGKLANYEEMKKYGLAVPPEAPVPEVIQKVQIVGDAVAPEAKPKA